MIKPELVLVRTPTSMRRTNARLFVWALRGLQNTGTLTMHDDDANLEVMRLQPWLDFTHSGPLNYFQLADPHDPASQVFLSLLIESLEDALADREDRWPP